MERHLEECPACAELARDSAAAVAFIGARRRRGAAAGTDHAHPVRSPWNAGKTKPSAWRKWVGGDAQPDLTARFAMGMAMTILSLAMLWRTVGPAPLQARDLRPAEDLGDARRPQPLRLGTHGEVLREPEIRVPDSNHAAPMATATGRRAAARRRPGEPGPKTDGRKLPVKSLRAKRRARRAAPSNHPGETQ